MSGFDYNVDNYTLAELKQIVGIPKEEQLTPEIIYVTMTKHFNSAANNEPLFRFFNQLKDRLTISLSDVGDEGEYDDDGDGDEGDDGDDEGEEGDDNIVSDETERKVFLQKNLINNPSGPVVQAQIFDGVPFGSMNPLDRSTVSKVICIDSVFRDAPETTPAESFVMNLPDSLDRVISLSLTSINLPNTWYNISSDPKLNTFYVKTINVQNMADTTHTVTVPTGNYDATQMMNTLNNIFSNTNGLRFVHVEINPVTLKTTFRAKTSNEPGPAFYAFDVTSSNLSPDFRFEVQFQSIVTDADAMDCDPLSGFKLSLAHDNIGYILGFRKPTYTVTKDPGYTDIISFLGRTVNHYCILQSEGIFDVNIFNYVFLELDDFNNNFVTNTVVSKTQLDYIGRNIIARIPVYSASQQAAGVIYPGNNHMFKTRNYFGPVRIEKLAVRLLNKYGIPLDMHGNNFSFVMEVVLQYS